MARIGQSILRSKSWLILLLLSIVSDNVVVVEGCTTIGVGKEASVDGSVFCSHSNDGEGATDPRLVLIPRGDWPEGSKRPIFYSPEDYPRYVGRERGAIAAYEPTTTTTRTTSSETIIEQQQHSFQKICEIPQVRHTYQYYEETYGALNERQLGIAESTCSGVFGAGPKGITFPDYGTGSACFSIDTLSQIAMERHSRARDAIEEMGHLAETYGFYGAGLFEGTSESLIVTDIDEVWVFHILPDPTGTSAIWVAQKIPNDSFAVVSNAFIIRNIDPRDDDNFLYSDSVYSVAIDLGWWKEEDHVPLDFTAIYSDGEYSHKYYSGRRSWGVYHLFAPSLRLPADYVEWRISSPYPVAARPDHKLSLEDISMAMRYFYEDTKYAQTGPNTDHSSSSFVAGGPWKSPDHVAGQNNTDMPHGVNQYGIAGNWERTIGLYRSSDTYIAQSRGWLPDSVGAVLWYGAYAAPYTIYTPFAAGMMSLPNVTLGHHMTLDKNTLFWASRYLGNYVQLKWGSMMLEVKKFQSHMMQKNLQLQARVDNLVLELDGNNDIEKERRRVMLEDTVQDNTKLDDEDKLRQETLPKIGNDALQQHLMLYSSNAVEIVEKIWQLCDHLMFRFADGQIHRTRTPLGTSTSPREYNDKGVTTKEAPVVDQPGYPGDWLEAVGYPNGPPPPPDCEKLQWKCGHQPTTNTTKFDEYDDGTMISTIRGGTSSHSTSNADGSSSNNDNSLQIAWNQYLKQKQLAIENGWGSCASRGDAAAAIGKCTKQQ